MKKITISKLVTISALLVSNFQPARAAELIWDSTTSATDGLVDGGGTWAISGSGNNHWWNGTTNVLWNNANSDSAVFGSGGAAAGTVTLGVSSTGVTVERITF